MKPARPVAEDVAADGDVVIVPSGEALRVASGWLGMSAEEALKEAGPEVTAQAAVPAKRPQFLGLGAKYLPHHKAVETASALDFRLRKRLERGLAARRMAEEDELEEGRGGAGPLTRAAAPPGRGGPRGAQGQRGDPRSVGAKRPAGGPGLQGSTGGGEDGHNDDTDSDGEERKATAVAGKAAAATGSGAGAMLGSKAAREAALLYAPVDGGGVKGRKGKGSKKLRAA
ncbi:hypothetical protein PLESTB_000338100 [Pleodorina starrii]|uniref:Uncharacterized protein n=1 Tax=Pleodorina starrii TaxID=330485 RepID=A0A9W6BEE5_9CHLO|nr:hypothetical protein PLESTM_000055900 [Pleodorina starrii]GLC50062.1 hypothetical protein PLESTB_000338100 [Pleodorina starrii]GLC73157.1 hypothetical protein PLESTF_001338200 [Pleodorina starrii]